MYIYLLRAYVLCLLRAYVLCLLRACVLIVFVFVNVFMCCACMPLLCRAVGLAVC